MKINNLAVNTVIGMKRALVEVGLIGLGLLGVSPTALANNNEARHLVVPYVHVSTGSGPYTTQYYISSATSSSGNVNVKCFNEFSSRIGPAGGTDITIDFGFDMDRYTLSDLLLPSDPSFTSVGWCYFRVTSGDDVAVGVVMGLGSGATTILSSNSSRLISADTAQSAVTAFDANIPFWTKTGGGEATGGGWETYLIAIDPSNAAVGSLFVDVYGEVGNLLGTQSDTFYFGKDLETFKLGAAAGATTLGNADVHVSGAPYFVGWILGINYVSLESFMYAVPLDKDDTVLISALSAAP
jgi:hypothetical protein